MNKGDILIAKRTQYYRNGSNAKFLTRGREYPIVKVDLREERIAIIDDERTSNYFRMDQIDKYFNIKPA